jgi:hypothetical protein
MGKGCKLCPGHIRFLLYKLWIGWSFFDWKSEDLVPFLRVKSKWRDMSPQNISARKFKRAILFNIVEKSSIGDVNLPRVLRTRAVC